jgi:maleylacetate reductase
MRRFSYQPPSQRIVFGAGAARHDLAAECDRLGAARLLLIATPGERARAEHVLAPLAGRIAGEFTEVRQHVPAPTAEAARRAAEELSADALLSGGGGSTTGTAKAVALESGLPIVAVPTTYAGSEVTPVWGLTSGGHKTTGRSPGVLPRTVVYDPEVTTSLPPAVTAASGMNATAHCVEALALPDTDPITRLLAGEGLRVLAGGLPAAVRDGADLDARGEVLYGAYLAGTAFAAAGSGVHHKMCHVLGGRFDLPHAETHTVLLPHVAAQLDSGRVARALGVEDAATALYELASLIGAPLALREIGLTDADLDEAVGLVVERVGLAEPDARRILRAAHRGGPPR